MSRGELVELLLRWTAALVLPVALVVVALGLDSAEFFSGYVDQVQWRQVEGDPGGTFGGLGDWFWDFLRYVYLVCILSSFYILLRDKENYRENLRFLTKWVGMVLVAALVFWRGYRYYLDNQEQVEEEEELLETGKAIDTTVDFDPMEAPVDDLVEQLSTAPSLLVTAISIATVLLVLYVVYTLWRRSQRRSADIAPDDWMDDLSNQAQDAIDHLRDGDDLRGVILRCYREMAQTAAESRGVQRQTSATPREFENTLRRIGLPEQSVKRLTELFEQVRYGRYRPTPRDRLEAIDSLSEIIIACQPKETDDVRAAYRPT